MDMDMIAFFADEAKETLQKLNDELLELEKNPNDMELINDLFRYAHTLKGASGMIGADEMYTLTHHMEDLMDKIRAGSEKVTSEKIDLLLECIEILEQMTDDYLEAGTTNQEVSDLVARIEGSKQDSDDTQPVKKLELTEVSKSDNLDADKYFSIVVELKEGLKMKGINSFVFLNKMSDKGEIISCEPSKDKLTLIQDKDFDGVIKFKYLSEMTLEDIQRMIEKFGDFSIQSLESVDKSDEDVDNDNENLSDDIEKVEDKQKNKHTQDSKSNQTVRIESDKIDIIINLIAELVIEKNKLELRGKKSEDPILIESIEKIDRSINHLQNIIMKVRMVPMQNTFKIFPREIRKIAKKLNKQIDFSIEGEDTELDRAIVDQIKDPLIHIIRNSLDHGLETPEERVASGKDKMGALKIIARYEGNQVVIEVKDDGRGVDAERISKKALEKGIISKEQLANMSEEEKVNLICAPGFSTAEKVTDLSGRGVGLDAVKQFIEKLNGSLEIETVKGAGTTIKLYVPLTLAIIQSMMIGIDNEKYAIPLYAIESILSVKDVELSVANSKEILVYKKQTIPITHLSSVVGLDINIERENYILLVKKGSKLYGLMVHEIIGQLEIVIKSLGDYLKDQRNYAGATILGDGTVALILDVMNILR